MNASLWSAALGVLAQQTNMDVVAHNIANINTVGYKRAITNFENLASALAQVVLPDTWPTSPTANDLAAALGAVQTAPKLVFSQGKVQPTDNALDVAIDGSGLFQVQRSDGAIAYTRDGTFKIDGGGQLTTGAGYAVLPLITVPATATGVLIRPNGDVYAQPASGATPQSIGAIQLASFADADALQSIGGNLYQPTPASGEATLGTPGAANYGSLRTGMLEMSNVDLVDEMASLVLSQRTYQMNLRTLDMIDQMVQDAARLQA